MKGRKPKPTKLKLLDGNPGKKKIKKEPEMIPGMPSPPKHLDEYALEEWNRLAEGLNAIGILTIDNQGPFSAYCIAYSRWRSAEEELAKIRQENSRDALILQTRSGNWIQQPLIGISNKSAADMVKYATEFGMTASAKSRLSVDPKKNSKFDGLIGKNVKK